MEKIAIITDSTSDLAAEQIKELGIHILPLKVIYKEREYTDRVDITPEEIFRNMHKEVPKTSLPSPGEVYALFDKLRQEGITNILSIHQAA
jgi:DegV family protein with EDD domain